MISIKWLDLEKGAVNFGQTQSNLIDDPETIELGEIHIQILVLVKYWCW